MGFKTAGFLCLALAACGNSADLGSTAKPPINPLPSATAQTPATPTQPPIYPNTAPTNTIPPRPLSSVFCSGNNEIDNATRFGRSELNRTARIFLDEALGGDRLARAGTDLLIGRGQNNAVCPR